MPPGLQQLAESIHKNDTKVFMQLSHVGGMTDTATTGLPVVAASEVVNPGRKTKDGIVPAALREDELRTIVRQFAAAAVRVKEAGFDGVDIHSAHS